jgi:murein DD-endopeptidase MepM/ murein hydrolase activator NlpD
MYPAARKIRFPLDEYVVSGFGFGANVSTGKILGIHLGEDARAKAGGAVKSVGSGEVVYATLHPGSPSKGNWGYVVIIGHRNFKIKADFYSLYGHLDKPLVKAGDKVKMGQTIGFIAPADTVQNGWWPAHLHFAIYVGLWAGVVLPGYFRSESGRTKLADWQNPSQFIKNYSKTKKPA